MPGNGLEKKFSFGEWHLDLEPFAPLWLGCRQIKTVHMTPCWTEVAYNFPADPLEIQRVHVRLVERSGDIGGDVGGGVTLPWSVWGTAASGARSPFLFRGT